MQLPLFYIAQYNAAQDNITLDEENSRHVVQVLRMEKGQKLHLTDGKGHLLTASIIDDHKKKCIVRIESASQQSSTERRVSIGISLLKNNSRFEWFLEKATEIGVTEIIPLICARTEKQKFRSDRMQSITISAMLQSRQCWLPVLHEPIDYTLLFRQEEVIQASNKFIAHCLDNRQSLAGSRTASGSAIILIGPEGDFTKEEVEFAIANHFIPVELGENRLRTETAGVVAAALLKMRN
jgi:16S rRNA (uracil1498-N3)-methyltransferase